ncbi:VC0807 family protein [Streptomyces sp. MST-110588]|uniref:VC0807 family protein n=1 Tax=Streptomyces sp. MST-110588 TaxID=2833628 RepID=UPI001F5D8DA5|nr:VC0807 family protein [Streptomyces sp. MST-110588]UNO40797.1 hypothetical protein KGS77_15935 [Streptomyces sp. MST-110588]
MQKTGPLTRVRPFVPILLDIVVPAVLYLGLKRLGVSDFWALTVAGVSTGVTTLINTIRRRRMDFVGILVVLEIALTVALLFVTDDPRVVAVKPSFYTAFTGVFLWVTCFVGRPVVYQAAAPMATKGDPAREIAYDRAWVESREFRSRERVMTAAFGAMLIAEAALRVFVVYRYSVQDLEKSFLLSQLPGIVLLVAVLGFFRMNVPALTRIVDGIQERVTASELSEYRTAGKGR